MDASVTYFVELQLLGMHLCVCLLEEWSENI